jgi:flagellar hook-basal body complex protein FliE
MSLAPLAAIAPGTGAAAPFPAAPIGADAAMPKTFDVVPAGTGAGAFDSLLAAVNQLNTNLLASDRAVRSLALGHVENLHQTMMSLEETKLSLQLLLQVRSGALEAYQELTRMQI